MNNSTMTMPFTSQRDQDDAATFIQALTNNGVRFHAKVEDRVLVIEFPRS